LALGISAGHALLAAKACWYLLVSRANCAGDMWAHRDGFLVIAASRRRRRGRTTPGNDDNGGVRQKENRGASIIIMQASLRPSSAKTARSARLNHQRKSIMRALQASAH